MSRVPDRIARSDWLALLVLYALCAASFPLAALVVDSGRDLAWGWSIAQGAAWPAYGPSLNALWQPGPVWFYFLALALQLSGSIGGVALVLGLFAAFKIPLAYVLGRALGQWQSQARGETAALGLTLAAAVALPGWSSLGQLVLSHTSLVETGVLATLWLALIAWRGRRLVALAGASLALGLAIHAHPTALVAWPALAMACWRVARERGWLVSLAASAGAFALPFLPALLAEAAGGWPQLHASGDYFGRSDYLARLLRVPAVLHGASAGSVGFVREFLLGRWPWPATVAGAVLSMIYLIALPGLLLACLRRERTAWLALALSALAWTLVLLLRDVTPAWMVYACAPLNALLVALGWQALWRGISPRAGGVGLIALAGVLSGAVLLDRMNVVRSGQQWFPGAALADIARPLQRDPPVRFWLPAYAHDLLATRLCMEPSPVALHGDLATALHFGQGVAVALNCADATVQLGGVAPRQLAGVPRAIATALGLHGEDTSWGYVLQTPVAVLHPAQGERVQVHTRYLLDDYRARAGQTPTRLALDAPCAADDVLVVSNLLPGLNQPFALRARSGDAAPTPLAETVASRYLSCPASGRFAYDLEMLEPRAADVFVLRRD